MEEEDFSTEELKQIIVTVSELIDSELKLTGEEHRNIRAALSKVGRFIDTVGGASAQTPRKGKRDA